MPEKDKLQGEEKPRLEIGSKYRHRRLVVGSVGIDIGRRKIPKDIAGGRGMEEMMASVAAKCLEKRYPRSTSKINGKVNNSFD